MAADLFGRTVAQCARKRPQVSTGQATTPPGCAVTRTSSLLAWYRANRRQLPWRGTHEQRPDAYPVLVSELMCQQTRVETAIPYFHRWMKRWPTLESLALANVDEVLAMWTGLGYYQRARNLLRAAKEAVATHGQLPADHAKLLQLPGVGPYTAGAIASIAFGLPAPLVDGNVGRVVARWFAMEENPTVGQGKRQAWDHAKTLLNAPKARQAPGDWNQALMELGAMVCTPRQPTCAVCPVTSWCEAKLSGLELKLPVPKPRRKPVAVNASYVVLLCGGKTLLYRRPTTGRWAGLWEPLGCEGPGHRQSLHDMCAERGIELPPAVATFRHALTHRSYEVTVYRHEVPARDAEAMPTLDRARKWMDIDDALGQTGGLSRLGQRAIETALTSSQPQLGERPS